MTLLITGGAGFIGSNFILYMMKKYPAYRIVCLDCLTYAANMEALKSVMGLPQFCFVKASINDAKAVEKVIIEERPDMVVNFAAESHVDRSIQYPSQFVETNVIGAQVLLDMCIKHNIAHFHQISTDEVYGDTAVDEKIYFDEKAPLCPSSPYSASKAAADLLALAYHRTYGLSVTISRSTNNYGPYQHKEKLIPLSVSKVLNEEKIPLYGDGCNIRDWLYVEDHCRAVDLIIHSGINCGIFNISGRAEYKNIEVVRLILSCLGKDEKYIMYVEDRKGHDRRYGVNSSLVRNKLDWKPTVTFEEGIFKTVNWYVHHQ